MAGYAPRFKKSLERKAVQTAVKIQKHRKNLAPPLKVWCLFKFYQFLHSKRKMTALDDEYWYEKRYTKGHSNKDI